MSAKRTLLKNGCVLSVDRQVGNFQQADVLIEGAKIAAVGPNLSAADAEIIDVETNVPNDMFTQMRSVISLQHAILFDKKLAGQDNVPAPLTTRDLLEFATIEGARANGLAHKTGSLTPGKEADLILLRTDKPNIFPVNDPIGAVVWGMDTSNVDSVFVAGQALKRNGQLLNVDLGRLQKMAYESRDYVVNKSGFKLPQI